MDRGRRVSRLPETRGRLTEHRPLSDLTWLRVGGPADWVFQPADADDLAAFLAALPQEVPVFPMGVGSNLIVRDGGIRGVVIRLGRGFNGIAAEGRRVTAGAAALDAHVARRAAAAGVDLTFLRTIPGTIGGAVRMNAGCYGRYVADVFVSARAMTRTGETVTLGPDDLNFRYRQTDLPEGCVLIEATFEGPGGDPAVLEARMAEQLAARDASQPTKERSAGSTFRNPSGYSSTGRADDTHELKAWKVIDAAGMRGARRGGAQMSEKHSNFLVNTGGATAADLEGLGEEVRKRVFQSSGIELEWEIMRVGEPAPET
jgi:UDP-N-acetylmuramate dehydrogenase